MPRTICPSAAALSIPLLVLALSPVSAQQKAAAPKAAPAAARLDTSHGDQMLADYFAAETKKIANACLADIKTLADWKSKRDEYRRQLREMLGLDPLPEKTDLKPVITGRLEHADPEHPGQDFIVEKLHFQSRPGLYVSGNLYLPKRIDKPLPTILYVCGHSRVLGKDGKTPIGAKAGYQHHGAWYARNGYACLTIDTLQLAEIEGIHHGTHRYGMWWWLNRGYTPAGVEAWNCVRALDYLETRPEIDKERFGVTGRSGGGAYSWWIAALDDRIKVAVPTAGITDLQNHVVDGTVEGHCDCMFMVNTYRWDYPQVAALVAPRPLLISNTDSDGIFPLDGVVRTFEKVRRIYRLFDSEKKGTSADIALNISPGPHKDTQELNTHEFRWFNHYLKNDDSPIDSRAPKYFQPEELKVFTDLPADQINTKIHETFVAKATSSVPPVNETDWAKARDAWKQVLSAKSFQAWTSNAAAASPSTKPKRINEVTRDGISLAIYEIASQPGVALPLYVVQSETMRKSDAHLLNILDDKAWLETMAALRAPFSDVLPSGQMPEPDRKAWSALKKYLDEHRQSLAYFAPRGVGPTAFDPADKKQVQNRRRFYLLGTTLDAMQMQDIISAIRAANKVQPDKSSLVVRSHRTLSGPTLYASLFEPDIDRLELSDLPKWHREGPTFLNVERFLDLPQAVATAAERTKIVLYQDDDSGWDYPLAVAKALKWPADQIQIRKKPADN